MAPAQPTPDLGPATAGRSAVLHVLGAVGVTVGTVTTDVVAPKRRAVLATLVLSANQPVAVAVLRDRAWATSTPPRTAAAALRNHIWALRTMLRAVPDVELETLDQRYLLRARPSAVDRHHFVGLAHRARTALASGDPSSAVEALDQALRLWRGPALGAVVPGSGAWPEVAELDELRLQVIEDRIDAGLLLGHHRTLVPRLERLVREHPGRERLRRQRAIALRRG